MCFHWRCQHAVYCRVICKYLRWLSRLYKKLLPFFFCTTNLPRLVSEKSDPWLCLLMVMPLLNGASWSCANSVNTFISCRLTAAAVERETSSGMNQMKEQIIPSSPWMTCSSDPESVFASLAPRKALLLKCSIWERESVFVWFVCVFACFFRLSCTCTTLSIAARRRWVLNHHIRQHTRPKRNLREWKTSSLNVQYIFAQLKRRNTRCFSLFLCRLLPLLRQWSSLCSCFSLSLCQRLLADLALTWPRKQKICSFLTEATKFNTQPFSPLCNPYCPRSFRPSDNNWCDC